VIEAQVTRTRHAFDVGTLLRGHDQAREQVIAVLGEGDVPEPPGCDRRIRAPALDAPVSAQLRERHGNLPRIAAGARAGPEVKLGQRRALDCRVS
jgi:hypothetical protein